MTRGKADAKSMPQIQLKQLQTTIDYMTAIGTPAYLNVIDAIPKPNAN